MKIKEMCALDVREQEIIVRKLLSLCIENTYTVEELGLIITDKVNSLSTHLTKSSGYAFGAYSEKRLCGLLWAYPYESVSGETFHIAYVSVLPEFEGKGIAKNLLSEAEIKAKELHICSLEVVVSSTNNRAKNLYVKQEFETDRLIMVKRLTSEVDK